MSERLEQEIDPRPQAFGRDSGVAAATIANSSKHQARPPSRLVWTLASILLLLVCLAIFIWTGIRGVDFGQHWDETKYQIGPVKTMVETGTLLPRLYQYPSVLIAAYALRGRLPAGQSAVGTIAKILVAFAVTFLVSTPGAVLQPLWFVWHARDMFIHYRYETHANYTVSPGLGHGLGILEYIGVVVFSPYAAFAAFFFLLAILGVYAILRQSGFAALIVVAFPIVNLGFMGTQQ